MVEDVVERLQNRTSDWLLFSDKTRINMRLGDIREALEEIERLRATMQELASKAATAATMCSNEGVAEGFRYLEGVARAALSGETRDD